MDKKAGRTLTPDWCVAPNEPPDELVHENFWWEAVGKLFVSGA